MNCNNCGAAVSMEDTEENGDEVTEVYECAHGHEGRVTFDGHQMVDSTGALRGMA